MPVTEQTSTERQLAAITEQIIETRAQRNALTETAESRALDDTEKRSLASVKADLDALHEKRDRVETRAQQEAVAIEARRSHVLHGMGARDSSREHGDQLEERATLGDVIEGRADATYLETRGLTTGGSTTGAETMATKVESVFYKTLDQYSGLWRIAKRRDTGLDESPLVLPILSGYGTADQEKAEGGTITADDGATGSVTFGSYRYTGIVNISNSLRASSAVDIEMLVAEMLAQRLVGGYRARLAIGTGSGQPQGITIGSTSGVTAAGTAAITADELVNLVHSVAPEVRDVNMSSWVMADATWQAIRLLKDGDGRYLVGDLANGAAMTLLGYNVQLDQSMPAMTTGLEPIAFGSIGDAFQIRHTSVRIESTDAARWETDETSYRAVIGLDSKVVDSSAIKTMTMA